MRLHRDGFKPLTLSSFLVVHNLFLSSISCVLGVALISNIIHKFFSLGKKRDPLSSTRVIATKRHATSRLIENDSFGVLSLLALWMQGW